MKSNRHNISSKAAALVENHSLLASLLAALCLVFAVNYFLTGPGSDGGSGLGGTGKFGGESGFGGTGKTPDSGFKLGSNDSEQDDREDPYNIYLVPQYSPADALDDELGLEKSTRAQNETLLAGLVPTPKPEFDVDALRLSPETPIPAISDDLSLQNLDAVDVMVARITLDEPVIRIGSGVSGINNQEVRETILADSLVASMDIINNLMLAEAESALVLESSVAAITPENGTANDAIRQRVSVPVRPERPDRFAMPSRISPVQRVNLPAPPPVRPMRTLSTLLNK